MQSREMSAAAVAEYIEVTVRTLYRYVAEGKFPPPTSGSRKTKNSKWSREIVDQWLDCDNRDRLAATPFIIERPEGGDAIFKLGLADLADYLRRNPTDLSYVCSFHNSVKLPLQPHHLAAIAGQLKRLSLRKADEMSRAVPGSTPVGCP